MVLAVGFGKTGSRIIGNDRETSDSGWCRWLDSMGVLMMIAGSIDHSRRRRRRCGRIVLQYLTYAKRQSRSRWSDRKWLRGGRCYRSEWWRRSVGSKTCSYSIRLLNQCGSESRRWRTIAARSTSAPAVAYAVIDCTTSAIWWFSHDGELWKSSYSFRILRRWSRRCHGRQIHRDTIEI